MKYLVIFLGYLQERYLKTIKGKGAPVGVKFFKDKKEAEKYGVKSLEDKRALCQAFKVASTYEKTRLLSPENIDACVIGSYVLGLSNVPEDLEDRWVKNFDYTQENFKSMIKGIENVKEKQEAAIIGPLKEFDKMKLTPDVVLLTVNSSQSYLLLVGFFDNTGKKPCSCNNGHAACEVIGAVREGKSPWFTLPCGGARGIADVGDDELWIGMSVDDLEKALERLEKVRMKYPPAITQMSLSEPNKEHPLTHLIKRN